mmetsp:Transcript_64547/g.131299  ORF Transcript_64547/g.131299 Transcript_64547/m.131299 type:complete len:147 (+) Transcript_64547:317-757(+)
MNFSISSTSKIGLDHNNTVFQSSTVSGTIPKALPNPASPNEELYKTKRCNKKGPVTPASNHLFRHGATLRSESFTDTADKALSISMHTRVVSDNVCGSVLPASRNKTEHRFVEGPAPHIEPDDCGIQAFPQFDQFESCLREIPCRR